MHQHVVLYSIHVLNSALARTIGEKKVTYKQHNQTNRRKTTTAKKYKLLMGFALHWRWVWSDFVFYATDRAIGIQRAPQIFSVIQNWISNRLVCYCCEAFATIFFSLSIFKVPFFWCFEYFEPFLVYFQCFNFLFTTVSEWDGDTLEISRISRLDMGSYLCIGMVIMSIFWTVFERG